jgi:hypothetical protein
VIRSVAKQRALSVCVHELFHVEVARGVFVVYIQERQRGLADEASIFQIRRRNRILGERYTPSDSVSRQTKGIISVATNLIRKISTLHLFVWRLTESLGVYRSPKIRFLLRIWNSAPNPPCYISSPRRHGQYCFARILTIMNMRDFLFSRLQN